MEAKIKHVLDILPVLLIVGIYVFLSVYFSRVSVQNSNVVKNLVKIQNNLSVECNPVQNVICNCESGFQDDKMNELDGLDTDELEKLESEKSIFEVAFGFKVKPVISQIITTLLLGTNLIIVALVIVVLRRSSQIIFNQQKMATVAST